MKIIQIDGIRGLITAAFVGVCLFAGFVIFPGYVSMHLWNQYLVSLLMFPELSLFQGVLLWGIVFVSYSIVTKGSFALSFRNTPELSDAELDSIIKSAKINSKMRMMNKVISKSDKVVLSKKKELSNSSKSEDKEISYISSPFSANKNIQNDEQSEEEKVS